MPKVIVHYLCGSCASVVKRWRSPRVLGEQQGFPHPEVATAEDMNLACCSCGSKAFETTVTFSAPVDMPCLGVFEQNARAVQAYKRQGD